VSFEQRIGGEGMSHVGYWRKKQPRPGNSPNSQGRHAGEVSILGQERWE
jgi:hypothetical protein